MFIRCILYQKVISELRKKSSQQFSISGKKVPLNYLFLGIIIKFEKNKTF